MTGAGGLPRQPHSPPVGRARRKRARAASPFQPEPRHRRPLARIRHRRSARHRFAGSCTERHSSVCFTLPRTTVFGPSIRKTFTIPTSAARKIFWAASKRAGVEQFVYTSTVATIAVDRPLAAQRVHRRQARRNDRRLQALQVDGRTRGLERREGRLASDRGRCPRHRSARGTGNPRQPES